MRRILALLSIFTLLSCNSLTPTSETASPKSLPLDSLWLVEDINSAGVVDMLQTTLQIDSEFKVSGMAGCNRFFGQATQQEQQIKFGPMGSTRKMCDETKMRQEMAFFKALDDTESYEYTGDYLFFLNASDQPVLRFTQIK